MPSLKDIIRIPQPEEIYNADALQTIRQPIAPTLADFQAQAATPQAIQELIQSKAREAFFNQPLIAPVRPTVEQAIPEQTSTLGKIARGAALAGAGLAVIPGMAPLVGRAGLAIAAAQAASIAPSAKEKLERGDIEGATEDFVWLGLLAPTPKTLRAIAPSTKQVKLAASPLEMLQSAMGPKKMNVQIKAYKQVRGGEYTPPYANPRIVFTSDKDFVAVGDVTPEDMFKMIQTYIKDKDEAIKAANWFDDMRNAFRSIYGQNEGDRQMLAFVFSQTKNSASSGLLDVLKLNRQLAGLPEPRGPSLAGRYIRPVLEGEMPTKGAAAKIADFGAALFDLNRQAALPSEEAAAYSAPVPDDVHWSRFCGFVDREFKARVAKVFGQAAADRLKLDLEGQLQGAPYEFNVLKAERLAELLNRVKYLGKEDWNGSSAMALGWSAFRNFMGLPPESAEIVFFRNSYRAPFETVPGQNSPTEKFFPDPTKLPLKDGLKINGHIVTKMLQEIAPLTGVKVVQAPKTISVWKRNQNPNNFVQVVGTPTAAAETGMALAYTWTQTRPLVYRIRASNKMGVRPPTNATIAPVNKLVHGIDVSHPVFRDRGILATFLDKAGSVDERLAGAHVVPGDPPTARFMNVYHEGQTSYLWTKKEFDALTRLLRDTAQDLNLDTSKLDFSWFSAEAALLKNEWGNYARGEVYRKWFVDNGRTDLLQRLDDCILTRVPQWAREAWLEVAPAEWKKLYPDGGFDWDGWRSHWSQPAKEGVEIPPLLAKTKKPKKEQSELIKE